MSANWLRTANSRRTGTGRDAALSAGRVISAQRKRGRAF